MLVTIGFDNEKYLKLQSQHIRDRIAQFGNKLYLEFGGKLIQKEVKRTAAYLDLLRKERHQDDSPALHAEEFEELVNIYREAGKKNLTEYVLLRVVSARLDMETAGIVDISKMLRVTDYFGYRYDGNLYILLTSTGGKNCGFMQKNLEEKGICTVISEEIGA